MTKARENYDLAIYQFAVYLLLTPFVLFIFVKSCITKRPWYAVGWFYLLGFLGLLIAALGLIIGTGPNGFNATGLVLESVGIAPLFIVVECVIRESVRQTRKANAFVFSIVGFIGMHLIIVAAAVLVGVGANKLFSGSDAKTMEDGANLTKAGVIVFIVPWLWLVAMTAVASTEWIHTNTTLMMASVLSLGLIVLRIIDGILEFYVTSSATFNPLHGNIVARLFLQVLPLTLTASILTASGVWVEFTRPSA